MKNIKELIAVEKAGDSLDDKELNALIQHYAMLEQLLQLHGERYHLIWKDTYERLNVLNGYKKSRAGK